MGNRLGRREEIGQGRSSGDSREEDAQPDRCGARRARSGAVECAVYFRHPRSSFEKRANERRSGLPRRFAEKGGSAGGMPAQLISKAADWNNNLPRKILGCKTPAEMFEIEILKTAQSAAKAPSISAWEEGKNPYGICCI
ncbi:MAG: hypothetical protein LBU32_11300 [Clostridiales bacterium]|nr:hypothetical protein [Clostridiales bacterium]